MKKSLVVICFSVFLAGSVAWADALLDAYQEQYKENKRVYDMQVAGLKSILAVGVPSDHHAYTDRLDRLKREKSELKIKLLEKYGKLPEWWTD